MNVHYKFQYVVNWQHSDIIVVEKIPLTCVFTLFADAQYPLIIPNWNYNPEHAVQFTLYSI